MHGTLYIIFHRFARCVKDRRVEKGLAVIVLFNEFRCSFIARLVHVGEVIDFPNPGDNRVAEPIFAHAAAAVHHDGNIAGLLPDLLYYGKIQFRRSEIRYRSVQHRMKEPWQKRQIAKTKPLRCEAEGFCLCSCIR